MEDALAWGRLRRAREVLTCWHQTREGSVRPVNLGENATFRVRSPRGVFALRLYRPGRWSDPEILVEHAFMRHLGEDLGVRPPLPGRDGETLQRDAHGTRASLFPWLPGRYQGNPTPRTLARLGEFVGHLHTRCLGYEPPGPRPRWDAEGLVEGSVVRLLERWPRLLPQLPEPDLGATVQAGLTLWSELAMPHALVHADLHWGNLKLSGKGFYPLDFDDCGVAPLAYDLATVAYATKLCAEPEGVESLVEAYNRTAPVPTSSEAVHLLTWARFLWLSEWILDRTELFPGRALVDRVRANMNRSREMARRIGLPLPAKLT